MAGYMDKTETQKQRQTEIKTLVENEEAVQTFAPGETIQPYLYDEAQMHDDVIQLEEKKTWKPDKEQIKKNEMIDKAMDLTESATADTLMVHNTLKERKNWKIDDSEYALSYLIMTEFDPKMLASANIRAHYSEYMRIVHCYEKIKPEINLETSRYAERLGSKLDDIELFYARMRAFTEQNRMHLDGTTMGEKEKASEFTLDRGKILKGDVFKSHKPKEYDFTGIQNLDKKALLEFLKNKDNKEKKEDSKESKDIPKEIEESGKIVDSKILDGIRKEQEEAVNKEYYKILEDTLKEEDGTGKYTDIQAFQETMMKDRQMGYKLHRYRIDSFKLRYDTTEARIAEIKDMREQIRYIENALDDKGYIQSHFDFFVRYPAKRGIMKREKLEVMSRLNLAEAEARLALALAGADTATIKAAQTEVLDAWDDYRRVQERLAKEGMPLTANPAQGSTMTKSEAIYSESDQQNYEYKKLMLAAAGQLPEDIPEVNRVKDLAIAYARETHYTIGCDEEAELLGELYKAMAAAEKKGYGDHMIMLNELKKKLNFSTIPDFKDIPDTTNLKLFDDTKIKEGMKLDFSKVRLEENGERKDAGHYRNAFMNNDMIRSWVDVSDLPIFPHEPTINDLRQGKVSNCYMLAATTSLIQHDPQAIKHVIRDNNDGTATVRLYRSPGEPVFIRIKKEVPRLRATGGAILTSGPLWMQLIEMAAAHVGMFSKNEEGKTKTGVGSLWYGTGAGWLQMLTGVPSIQATSLLSTEDGETQYTSREAQNADELFERIREAKSRNRIINMGTKDSTTGGFNDGHAYTVLGAREIDGVKYVTLRNPYANMSYQRSGNGKVSKSSTYFSSEADETHGQFDVPLEDFIRNAKSVTVTDLSPDSESGKYFFADEKVTLKQVADHGGTVPGLKEFTRDQFMADMMEGEDLIEQLEREMKQEEQVEDLEHLTRHMHDNPELDQLMKSSKTFGDSKLMKAVKENMVNVEKLLNKPWKQDLAEKDINEIRNTYFKAIASCDTYLAERHSTKKSGMMRRSLVEKNRTRLIRELEYMETGAELYLSGRLELEMTNVTDEETGAEATVTLRTMLVHSKVYGLGGAPMDKRARQKEKTSHTASESLRKVLAVFDPDRDTVMDEKQVREYAASIGNLRREIKSLPKGKSATVFVVIAGQNTLIRQDEDGTITITNGDASVVMKENAADLLSKLDYKMIEEQDRMDPEDMKELIGDQTVEMTMIKRGKKQILTKNAGDVQKASTRLARYLELKTGKPATYFSNYSTDLLRTLAYGLASGAHADVVLEELERIEKKNDVTGKQINTSETLELVRTSQKKKTEIAQKVTYKVVEKTAEQKHEDRLRELNGWTEEEFAVKNMISDLVFSQDTWEADESMTEPGERVRRMLIAHKDALAEIVADNYREDQKSPSLIDKIMDKLPMALVGKDEGVFRKQVKSSLTTINAMIDEQMEVAVAQGKKAIGSDLSPEETTKKVNALKRNKTLIRSAISAVLTSKDPEVMEELKGIDDEIQKMVEQTSDELQGEIESSIDELFKSGSTGTVDPLEGLKDPEEKGITPQEKEARIKAGTDALTKVIEDSMKGDSGQGKFVKTIFENYFRDANIIDRRSMFAAALRNAAPSAKLEPLPEGATKKQIEEYEAKLEDLKQAEMGRYLGGILKGAGPLFQKILQGLPTSGMHETMQQALADVKSKLAPIPEEIVKAQLYGMVERSKGKITKIEISRALGAASVGQTFLCKIYGPDIPEEGKDVVVKLLKPDVRNRMMREKAVMLKCARMTDAGMVATYEGQLSRIEEELDLTIEARNVVKGEIYNKSTAEDQKPDGVQSMKLVELIDATTNSMMLEKAPGETVDRFLTEAADRIRTYKDTIEKRPGETKEDYSVRINLMRENIARDMAEMAKRQKYMAILSKKWVTEGIFGKGFYHGDLHAGNIMIDDNGVTVIDFGNATSLDDNQQVNVTRMVGAAAVGDADGFLKGLYELLKPEFKKKFDQEKSKLRTKLKSLFALGDQNASGQRVAVALIKTQELGIEVPSAIFNFSQCQLRLQAAVDDMVHQIETLEKLMREVDKKDDDLNAVKTDIYVKMLKSMGSNGLNDTNEKESRKIINTHYDKVTTKRSEYNLESLDMYDEMLDSGKFIKDGVEPFYHEDDFFTKRIDKLVSALENGIREVKENQKKPVADRQKVDATMIFNVDAEIVDLTQEMVEVSPIMDVQLRISKTFDEYQKELSRGDKADQTKLKELGGEGDNMPQWIADLKEYLLSKANTVTEMTSKAKKFEEIRQSDAKSEEKVAAREDFKKAYRPFRVNCLLERNQDLFIYMNMDEHAESFRRAVERTAAMDEELGPQLLNAYVEFSAQRKIAVAEADRRIAAAYGSNYTEMKKEAEEAKAKWDAQQQEKKEAWKEEHPEEPYVNEIMPDTHIYKQFEALDRDRVRETANEKLFAREKVRSLAEKVLELIITISCKRYEAFYENMEDAYMNVPRTFVDVMGEAIKENLKKSLARLGYFTAYSYSKKLQ